MIKRVVMTGPTGEIGIALLKIFAAKKIEVLAICRPGSVRKKYIPDSKYIKVIEYKLSELNQISGISEGYDVFYHFGWCASYGEQRDNLYLQNYNIRYELDAVHLAERLGCRIFIGAGSQAEYGRKDSPLTPDMPAQPETAYGIAKLCAGSFSRLLCREKNIRHIWVRIASVYGPCDGPYTLITYIMQQLGRQENIILTPCEQEWDYLYAKDAAQAFVLLAEHGMDGKIYCLGSGRARALIDYMREVQEFAKRKGIPTKVVIGGKPYQKDQMMYLCADIRELKNDTGFCPEISFPEGLELTYRWYCEQEGKDGIPWN